MVQHSQAALYLNTTVASIAFVDKGKGGPHPRYTISTKAAGAEATTAEQTGVKYDNIIIASPWQYSNITAGDGVIKHRIDEIPYVKLHVTLFTSPFKLRPGYFGLAPGSKSPSSVYTTLKPDEEPKPGAEGVGSTGFYSISTLRTVINPATQRLEFAYKIFSAEPVTAEFLSDILGAEVPPTFTTSEAERKASSVDPISWIHAHWFHAYPMELPRVTFQDPVVGTGVYYTSGIESFISTMETSALMGKNVARLIADDFAGIQREGEVGTEGSGSVGSEEL